MLILLACEESAVVREAFRSRGHKAYSCDVLPCGGDSRFHLRGDVRRWIDHPKWRWDIMIAFPPCTDIAVSGARYFAQKRADGRQQRAIAFVRFLADAPIPAIGIENPIGILSSTWRKPDQIIQPWQFGHAESKATCLWLKGLPPLVPTNILRRPASGRWANQTPSGQNKLGPSPERAQIRSRTYAGIAAAMADQWGGKYG